MLFAVVEHGGARSRLASDLLVKRFFCFFLQSPRSPVFG